MTWREKGRGKAIKYEQQAKRQCTPPLDFTSLMCLCKFSKKYGDEASICRRQRRETLKPNPSQFHELHLFSPLTHSKGNPKLLEVTRRAQAQAQDPLLVLQLCRQVASLRPELLDQVLLDPPGRGGRGPGVSVKALVFEGT